MARWVRDRLEENPAARIGVIVPEFAAQREFVAQALDDMLVPQAIRPGHQSVERPYNLSLGLPLSAYPIVRTALTLLGLLNKTVSLEAAGTCFVRRLSLGGRRKLALAHYWTYVSGRRESWKYPWGHCATGRHRPSGHGPALVRRESGSLGQGHVGLSRPCPSRAMVRTVCQGLEAIGWAKDALCPVRNTRAHRPGGSCWSALPPWSPSPVQCACPRPWSSWVAWRANACSSRKPRWPRYRCWNCTRQAGFSLITCGSWACTMVYGRLHCARTRSSPCRCSVQADYREPVKRMNCKRRAL